MNIIDRAVAYISPIAGARRMAARATLDAAQMHYDGATRGHRAGWRQIGHTSANTEVAMSLPRLRDVCRDFGRNNPIAALIHTRIPAHVIGAGIIPSVDASNKRSKEIVQGLIADHLDTTAIDYDGRNTFYGLQALVIRSVVESGEVLVARYQPPASRKLPVPVQIRVMESDYLDITRNGPAANGNVLFQGIEFSPTGQRVAYWLYSEHPGGGLSWKLPVSKRVPAENVLHIFRQDRAGQQRGIPWGAPGVLTQWNLADYEDAELMRQKIAACFAIFFTGADSGGLAATASKTAAGNPIARLEPGLIQALPNGAQVTTATPPVTNGYRDVTIGAARKICMAYGVPYEVGTGDLSGVSFISGRLGRIDFNLSIDQWRWHMLIPHMCAGVGGWFLDALTLQRGVLKGSVRLTWTPPRREMVSPKDEIPAMRDATRAGFVPRSEQVRSLGFDPEAVEAEYKAENDRADADNLRFDSDGRFPINTKATEAVPPVDDTGETSTDPNAPDGGSDKGQK